MATVQGVSTADPIVIPIGTRPPILDVILAADGTTEDLSLATVSFFMRPLESRAPLSLTGTASVIWPADEDGNTVQFVPSAQDTTIEGQYMGWWGYSISSGPVLETPEFRIVITDQGPGFGVETGAVVDALSQYMPITVSKLRADPTFGDRWIQRHADYVKRITLGTVVPPDSEVNYDPLVIDYLAKRTALRLIAPAKDFWARQYTSVRAQSPGESANYPDMLKSLDALAMRLKCELPQDWRQLNFLVPGLPQLHVEPRPMSSLGDPSPTNRHNTPDPRDVRRPRTGGPFFGGLFFDL